ncbi:UTP--glucose-1-phosphate uridylyltransferase [Paenibacillus solanacearum]|uniref:UTP--glucose-1-phosphate uridylyltransferase n=1 Tax=Paenibacillus solanacearum TaxID=2048548 RepID=A0A916K4R9_9BACL|nr:UTP--glucose-1-phosphate uridylyltransferase GalU [Paenibacillus solanacearum]CAG7630388.1 UTP--glucose-1-phosphate uridylyltransferase [Paenibacillus solanacearum]
MKVRKAIIPAAGLGTRFLPATKAMPKEMLPIIDKPTIQFIVEEAVESGIEDIIIVTGKGKRAIEDHFDAAFELEYHLLQKGKLELHEKVQRPSQMIDIHYIRQKEPKGLGHAVWCARKFIKDEPFAVLLGDTFLDANPPCLKQMIDYYDRYKTSIIGVQPVERSQVSSYGVVDARRLQERLYVIDRLVEKPKPQEAPSNLAMIGRYILTPAIFDILEYQEAGVGKEIQLTDAIATLNLQEAVYACEVSGTWHDVGDHLGYIKAMLSIALHREDLREPVIRYLKQALEPSPAETAKLLRKES